MRPFRPANRSLACPPPPLPWATSAPAVRVPPAPRQDAAVTHSTAARRGMAVLVTAVAVLLAVVIAAPIALSSQDLVEWAASAAGLGLSGPWPLFVFVALDAAAATCVGMVVYSAWRGETGGAFAVLVWLFAAGSAAANYRHGVTTPARDDQWFFPAMSLAGPALLEVTVRRVRRWVQTSAGRYERPLPHFRLVRWVPGIAARETLRAWKLAVTEGYSRPEDAVTAARAYRAGWRPGAGELADDRWSPPPCPYCSPVPDFVAGEHDCSCARWCGVMECPTYQTTDGPPVTDSDAWAVLPRRTGDTGSDTRPAGADAADRDRHAATADRPELAEPATEDAPDVVRPVPAGAGDPAAELRPAGKAGTAAGMLAGLLSDVSGGVPVTTEALDFKASAVPDWLAHDRLSVVPDVPPPAVGDVADRAVIGPAGTGATVVQFRSPVVAESPVPAGTTKADAIRSALSATGHDVDAALTLLGAQGVDVARHYVRRLARRETGSTVSPDRGTVGSER